MTIFRHKNGKLYTIERVSPRAYTGHWYEVTPYKHKTPIRARLKQFSSLQIFKEFRPVAFV